MTRSFKQWFAAPAFEGEEEKAYQASLLNTIVITVLLFAALVLLGNLLGRRTPTSVLLMTARCF
jgi:hypothetical protein